MPKPYKQPSFFYFSHILLGALALFLVGCSEESYLDADKSAPAQIAWAGEDESTGGEETFEDKTDGESLSGTGVIPKLKDRKVVYVSEVWLVLKETSFEQFEKDIKALIGTHGGYQSEVTFHRNQGQRRSGRWVVRMPVDHYPDFLKAAKDLGVPEQVQETAKDVTAEYVDLDARIANQKRLEQRILGVLDEVKGKIADVLEVERQLSRVRETIERLEGKMRYLKDRVSMTTITLNVREDADYQPPQALSFSSSIADAWDKSIGAMGVFFKGAILTIVAMSPWLLIVFTMGYLLYRFFRRFTTKRQKAAPTKAS